MFENRLICPLEKGLSKGNNLFFTYGMGVKDYFLYNFYEGILSANETYKRFFLSDKKVKTYVHIKNKTISCYQFEKNKYEDITEQYFLVDQEEDAFGDMDTDTTPTTEEGKEIQKKGEENNTAFSNDFTRLEEIIKEKKETTAIFFEEFEWLAGLYSSNPDLALEYVKRIKDLNLLKNAITIVSLEDIELIKKYNFDIEGTNSIYIGNPSSKEIQLSYLRKYMRETENNHDIPVNTLSELNDISQAISSGNKSLRAAMRIYNTVISSKKKKIIDKTDFEIAVEKILEEKISLDDVILDQETKNRVLGAVDSFLTNTDSKNYRKGLILTGPSGTGKTYLVKAIANERNCFFMAPSLSDLKGEYVGQTSSKVRKIFDQARANQPAILFIDEADTIFPDRNLAGSTSDSFNLDMVNQFLVEIDGMVTGSQKIFVIAATNRIGVLDSAIKSRLSESIEIGLPNKLMRKELFSKKLMSHKFLFKEKSFCDEVIDKTENMSGRDIDNFVKKLVEEVQSTPYVTMDKLKDDKDTRELFLRVLNYTENALIDELQRKVSVEIYRPQDLNTKYNDIIGYEDIKKKIKRQAFNMCASPKEKMESEDLGIKHKKGILLYGPPGNAKSKLAEAVAKEYNLYFAKVISKDFASVNFENQLRNLQLIFDQTLRLSKMCSNVNGVLLFFDEFDSLASSQILNSVIRGTLLDYLSNENENGIRSNDSKILFMAATNFYDVLDEALIRRGRIDEHIFMDNPTRKQGKEIMKQFFDNDKNIEKVHEDIISSIYDSLYNMKRQAKKALELEKLRIQTMYAIDEDKASEFIDTRLKNYTPSGAEIIDLCKEIKEEAYYLKKLNAKKELVIDEEFKNYFQAYKSEGSDVNC